MSQLRRLQDWWLGLPLSYRVNALLYLLGAFALIFLLTSLFSGDDDPRQIQVGAGVATSTSTTRAAAGTPTTVSRSSTTAGGSTTTTRPGSTTTVGSGAGGGGGSGAGGGSTTGGGAGGSGDGGGGGSDGSGTDPPQPPGGDGTSDTTSPTTPPPPTGTTTPAACRNSTESRCGDFRWDPAPTNQAPAIEISSEPRSLPSYDQTITFIIHVTEPDHVLSGACGTMEFGDGTSDGSCPPPACGATRYGPWDTPGPGGPASREFRFQHRYEPQPDPRAFVVTFRLESRSDCYDPYGTAHGDASGTKTATIVVTVP